MPPAPGVPPGPGTVRSADAAAPAAAPGPAHPAAAAAAGLARLAAAAVVGTALARGATDPEPAPEGLARAALGTRRAWGGGCGIGRSGGGGTRCPGSSWWRSRWPGSGPTGPNRARPPGAFSTARVKADWGDPPIPAPPAGAGAPPRSAPPASEPAVCLGPCWSPTAPNIYLRRICKV